jgi:endonuclease/exonuclease/phosphatase family metal-dependent hydrolase
MKILLGDFNAKVGREDIFKPTIGNESLHEISNDNGIRVVNFATSKNLRVKSTMLPHRNIHKYTWMSPDGKTHNQIDHFLVDRRWHSSVLDVRSFRAACCDTDHYLVVAKVRERLAVNKQSRRDFIWRGSIS